MEFYQKAGPMALGSRLRRVSELVTENAGRINQFYELPLEPKWFPVFYLLGLDEELSVTQIAKQIGHSHPSVSQMVKEMKKNGLIKTRKSNADARVHLVRLTTDGRRVWEQLELTAKDVGLAVEALLADTVHNLWEAMTEFEQLLSEQDLFSRVVEVYKERESKSVEILDYQPIFFQDLHRLHQEWAASGFEMEAPVPWSVDSPEARILDRQGLIKLARLKGEIVGCGVLVKREDDTHELAILAVTEETKGKGIDRLLLEAVLQSAQKMGIKRIGVESDTRRRPVIDLYRRLGFRKMGGSPSEQKRGRIRMEFAFV